MVQTSMELEKLKEVKSIPRRVEESRKSLPEDGPCASSPPEDIHMETPDMDLSHEAPPSMAFSNEDDNSIWCAAFEGASLVEGVESLSV